jgi:endonuclease VIII
MPEGDTILSIAQRLRPVLVGHRLEQVAAPQRRHALDRWPEKLAGTRIESIDTHGKNLFLRFDNHLTVHSHLRMSGRWRIFEQGFDQGKRARAAWLVLETSGHSVVQYNGPILTLMRDSRMRFDPYLRRLGPDVLAKELDWPAILIRMRADDPTRPVGDALMDQRSLAGIGNLWKNESLYACGIDPWRPLAGVTDAELEQTVRCAREMMLSEVRKGGRLSGGEVFEQAGKACRRCGTLIQVRGQWDENRMTYWCSDCQS